MFRVVDLLDLAKVLEAQVQRPVGGSRTELTRPGRTRSIRRRGSLRRYIKVDPIAWWHPPSRLAARKQTMALSLKSDAAGGRARRMNAGVLFLCGYARTAPVCLVS
jgi:hypothetical protein